MAPHFRSVMVRIRPSEGTADRMPSCPRCWVRTTSVTLCAPGWGVRVWQWLVGRPFPRAFVYQLPCGHVLGEPKVVNSVVSLVEEFLGTRKEEKERG